jgi:hypothetical protein
MKNFISSTIIVGLMMVAATSVAGEEAGPRRTAGHLASGGSDRYEFRFEGGKKAEVWVRGSKTWNLKVEVLDLDGTVVVSDVCKLNSCHVKFEPALNCTAIIRVVNNSNAEVSYRLATN